MTTTPETIIKAVSDGSGFSPEQLLGRSRSGPVAFARQIAMYLCREETDLSLPAIGRVFDRDHSTVLYAHQKIDGQLRFWRGLRLRIAALRAEIARA